MIVPQETRLYVRFQMQGVCPLDTQYAQVEEAILAAHRTFGDADRDNIPVTLYIWRKIVSHGPEMKIPKLLKEVLTMARESQKPYSVRNGWHLEGEIRLRATAPASDTVWRMLLEPLAEFIRTALDSLRTDNMSRACVRVEYEGEIRYSVADDHLEEDQ